MAVGYKDMYIQLVDLVSNCNLPLILKLEQTIVFPWSSVFLLVRQGDLSCSLGSLPGNNVLK